MAQSIREVMTKDPVTVSSDSSIVEVARAMKDSDIGNVIVMEGDQICGIVTDRDIAIRAVADGRDVKGTSIGEICTRQIATVTPDDPVAGAVKIMREKAVRRLPVVEGDRPIGVVSIGDLAIDRDPESALADISRAPGNN